MTEKRFIGYFVGDTLVSIKDTVTNKRLNILQIVEVANKISDENEQLKQAYQTLKHRHSLLHDECLETECDRDSLKKDVISLEKENGQLKKEKEFWKGDSCNCSNYLSILSMDCQIVQETICDLKNVIDVDTEASKLLDKLDDKFDELNQHRIKMYSR